MRGKKIGQKRAHRTLYRENPPGPNLAWKDEEKLEETGVLRKILKNVVTLTFEETCDEQMTDCERRKDDIKSIVLKGSTHVQWIYGLKGE